MCVYLCSVYMYVYVCPDGRKCAYGCVWIYVFLCVCFYVGMCLYEFLSVRLYVSLFVCLSVGPSADASCPR